MPIYVRKKGADFIPAPEGLHHSVCVDAVELGMVDGAFGRKHMVKLVWQTKQKMENGKPYMISKRYTASLHEKATLRLHLESWRGKKFTDDEAAEFDIEKLIGANCQISVAHNVKGEVTYANVLSIVAAPSVLGKLQPMEYERVCARPGYVQPEVDEEPPPPTEEEGLPHDELEEAPF